MLVLVKVNQFDQIIEMITLSGITLTWFNCEFKTNNFILFYSVTANKATVHIRIPALKNPVHLSLIDLVSNA
jgi:hypothetical protein